MHGAGGGCGGHGGGGGHGGFGGAGGSLYWSAARAKAKAARKTGVEMPCHYVLKYTSHKTGEGDPASEVLVWDNLETQNSKRKYHVLAKKGEGRCVGTMGRVKLYRLFTTTEWEEGRATDKIALYWGDGYSPPVYKTDENRDSPRLEVKLMGSVTRLGSIEVDFKSTGSRDVDRKLVSHNGQKVWVCYYECRLEFQTEAILFTAGSEGKVWASKMFNYRKESDSEGLTNGIVNEGKKWWNCFR